MKSEFVNILLHSKKSKDEDEFRQIFLSIIPQPINLLFVEDISRIQEIFIHNKTDIVFLNLEEIEAEKGMETIHYVYTLSPKIPIIVITDYEENTLEFIKAGAEEVIQNSALNTTQFIKTLQCTIDRKRRNNKLLIQTDYLLKQIIDNTTESVFVKDLNGKYLLANDAVARVTNKKKEEILGKDDTYIHSPENAKIIMDGDKEVLQNGKTTGLYINIKTHDGINKIYDATKGPVKDGDGNVIGIFGISRDVTSKIEAERRLAENELKLKHSVSILHSTLESIAEGILVVNNKGEVIRYNQSFKELWDIPEQIINSNDDKILLEYVLNQLKEPELFLQKVQDLYANPDEISFDIIEFKDGRIFERYSQPQKAEGISIGRVWSFRNITEKYIADEELILKNSAIENAISGIGMTDLEGNIIYGNVTLLKMWGYNDTEELIGKKLTDVFEGDGIYKTIEKLQTYGFDKGEDIAIRKDGSLFDIEFAANVVMDKNGNPKCMFGSFIDITERKNNEQELIQTVSVLQSTLESSSEGIYVVSNEGKIIIYNSAFKKFWKIPDELFNSGNNGPILQFVLDQLKFPEAFYIKVQQLYSTPEQISFDVVEFKDGRIFERYSQPYKVNNKSLGRVWSFRDVTAIYKYQQNLKLKDSAIANAISGMGMADLQGNMIYANSTLLNMWGCKDHDEMVGKSLNDLFQSERVSLVLNHLRNNGSDKGEGLGKKMDGSIFNVEFSGNVVFDDKGNPTCLFGSFIDITERKRLEQSLQESETLFRELAENSPGGIVLLDENNKYKYVSSSTKRIMGYNPEHFIGKDPIEHTHPDDISVLVPKLKEVLTNPDKVITAQYRFKHADSSWRWIESTFSNLLHIQNVNSLLINFHDITEKVNSEELIVKLSRAVEHSSVSVVITNLSGNIEYVNPHFSKVTGYTSNEVEGRNISIMKSGLTLLSEYKTLWETILTGKEWNSELANKKKDGTIFWESVSISPVLDKTGKITHFIAVKEDITERKKAEKELQESYEKERQLIEHLQNVREEERAKISREFHDEIGQHLTVLKMDVAWLNKKARFKEDTAVAQRLDELQSLLDETVKSFRRILSDLRPTLIDDVGVEAAMEWHLQEFGRKNNIKTNFIVHLTEIDYPENISLPLFRILQESLNNISKHANAKNVTVSLIQEGKNIELTIHDDGIGFDKKQIKDKRSFGIMGMKERVTITGGVFDVNSIQNQGTTIKVSIPLKIEIR